MKHVYGPVPSRRLGRSLGIDPIPLKTCNYNCVYCQLGRSTPLTNRRQTFAEPGQVVAEVKRALESHAAHEIDWVTFVGSGEPTLHQDLGWMIRAVKATTRIPVAVITNGGLLHRPEVRRELRVADAVLPTLDAGSASLFRRINRSHPDLSFVRLIEGMIAFRQEFRGALWVEVMLVRGVNETDASLEDLEAWLQRIRPDEVHLSLPIRPPAESWVRPARTAGIARATARLGKIARVLRPPDGEFDLSGSEDLVDAVVAVITRHPMRQDELERALERWAPGELDAVLSRLLSSGQAKVVTRYGARFWTAGRSRHRGSENSARAARR
jgi:wyosine [tRNA(Phe)-imidazoG37] synthetase (radical SAM superfamily)